MLTYALFPQIGLKFLKNRDDKQAFEPAPQVETKAAVPAKAEPAAPAAVVNSGPETYTVKLNGKAYVVEVSPGGDIGEIKEQAAASGGASAGAGAAESAGGSGESIDAPLAGNIFKVNVRPGDQVAEGDVVIILEAMKIDRKSTRLNSSHRT